MAMLQRLFHVNICVRDMERSIRFYEGIGFKKVNDFTLEDPSVGDALGVKARKIRGVFVRLGDDPNAPVLDLVQFIDPPTQGQPYPTLNNVGICRIAFTVDDIDKTYEELKAKKVEFVAPLKKIDGPGGNKIGVVCFKDPDGTILELISGM
jgi:glyoxylase I family protein